MSISAPPRYLPARRTTPTASGRRLSFSRQLPPGAVHKASASEVFLTDARRTEEDRFTVAALWRRDGFLHHDGNSSRTDPLLLVETVRQALIHVSHRFYGIPQGHPFVLNALEFDLQGSGSTAGHEGPVPVVLDVACTRTARTPRRLGMTLEAVASVDGARIGRVRMHWEMLDSRLYAMARDRTRQQAQARPAEVLPEGLRRLDPRQVGYGHDDHVLLARDPGGPHGAFWLDMNLGHPVLFDHPCDHVPGMVLLEAFRQAVAALGAPSRPTLTRVAAVFKTFGELDAPVRITVRPGPGRAAGPRSAEVTAVQGDTTLVSAHVAYQVPQGLTRREAAA
ncbi:ScbA/BarX family gamma-butyrolactone biosynthesis protein [Streptomyces sp. NPDC058291]|jgi:hypothetical protein|uniref:ScbA/BarX family gamma-butyrolactone biosynthesis protein n=1 Tax=Streptomyces sp. NPDC058291 TaxID=3346427 RepID=UPI0036EC7841